jgi:hypothetical protein
MEVAAIEEVVTTEEKPAVKVAGMFDKFKRVPTKRALTMAGEGEGSGAKRKKIEGHTGQAVSTQSASIIVAANNDCYRSVGLPDMPQDFQIYHTVVPGLKTPYDLPIECFPDIEKLLEEEGTKVEIINTMLQGTVIFFCGWDKKEV